jgi:hypothetical protein
MASPGNSDAVASALVLTLLRVVPPPTEEVSVRLSVDLLSGPEKSETYVFEGDLSIDRKVGFDVTDAQAKQSLSNAIVTLIPEGSRKFHWQLVVLGEDEDGELVDFGSEGDIDLDKVE